MSRHTVPLVLFLLLEGHQGQECSGTTEDVIVVSGNPLCLRPNYTLKKEESFEWKKQQGSYHGNYGVLFRGKFKEMNYSNFDPDNSKNTISLNNEDLTLLIKSPKLQHSGYYILEVTNSAGRICRKTFKVLILDPVEKPHLQVQWKGLANGTCQVSLYCLVSEDNNVSYALYRGSTQISTERNFTCLEKQTDVSGRLTYTCNVSNTVSWESHTLNFTQGCLSVALTPGFLPFLVIAIILVTLFLAVLISCCVWDKKKRQSQPNPKEHLTVYEDIKDHVRRSKTGQSTSSRSLSAVLEDERGQRELDRGLIEEQMQEQKPPGEGITIYSVIQRQSPASTPQETTSTLYSVIQPFKSLDPRRGTIALPLIALCMKRLDQETSKPTILPD